MEILPKDQSLATVLDSFRGQPGHTLVYYTAPWCGPCRVVTPALQNIAEDEITGATPVRFIKVDVDDHEALVDERQVDSIPHFEVYKGTECVQQLPAPSVNQLVQLVRQLRNV